MADAARWQRLFGGILVLGTVTTHRNTKYIPSQQQQKFENFRFQIQKTHNGISNHPDLAEVYFSESMFLVLHRRFPLNRVPNPMLNK